MQADIAANSLSTLRNSQEPSSPAFTICERPSTMWVCGEIGYAQMTSGRHAATVSATAREPSICLSTGRLPHRAIDEPEGRLGRRGVALARLAREAPADGGEDRSEAYDARQRGEPAQQRGARQRTAQVLASQVGGRDRDQAARHHVVDAEGVHGEAG